MNGKCLFDMYGTSIRNGETAVALQAILARMAAQLIPLRDSADDTYIAEN
jgi:hypothetical protein